MGGQTAGIAVAVTRCLGTDLGLFLLVLPSTLPLPLASLPFHLAALACRRCFFALSIPV
jgi:hypothetical protein